ncbi:MAG TPA: 5-formyltetrahydrofolate cyclo-ligase [Phycisphaerae bacterium]|nr:5-formyltetrahydrofolate cyclo-ligase [Phycisphaerae bacterium]
MTRDEIAGAKMQVRRSVSAALANLGPDRRRIAAVALARCLAGLGCVRRARTLMAFLSMPTEIDTWPLIRWAWGEGKRVAVPRIEPPLTETDRALGGREIEPVLLERADVPAAVEHPAVRPGAMGILEVPDAPPLAVAELDVVLVPCQALDRRGNRLGKGGGFYDRFLARADLRADLVAVAFREQILDEMPVTENDRPVPTIVTDAGIVTIEATGGGRRPV